ncbi:MAG: FAD-dependent oxidoreductase [Reyranella sp.]|nr:FAD-dependent oxidoreductase [Reyranella sp.]
MDNPSYDLIVVGSGPAGLTAATEAARAGLKCLCLDKLAPGGQLINLGALHEFDEIFTGTQMASLMTDDAVVAGVEIGFGEVTKLSGDGPWSVETAEGERHTGRAVVIATGLHKGRLGVPNEDQFEGRGVSHCAVCDGPLYTGLPVIVAGATGWAAPEAVELTTLASEVTVVDSPPVQAPPGVKAIDGRIVGLEGTNGLESVVIEAGGLRNSVPASAVFVYINRSPAAEFLPESLARDATGHIVVDMDGRTSSPTLFAVGDVRAGGRQYLADAIADGQRAAKAIVATLGKTS